MTRQCYQMASRYLTLLPSLFLLFQLTQPAESIAQETRILYIYDATQNTGEARDEGGIRDEDHLYLSILEDQLGYEAVLIDQNDVSPADTAGVDAIYISESVGSGTVVANLIAPTEGDGAFANFDKPIIAAEVFVMDDMLWIKSQPQPPYGTDFAFGFAESEKVNILPVDHPILGGLRQGPLTVYADHPEGEPENQIGYAVPNGAGTVLAALPGTAQFNAAPVVRFPEMRGSLFVFEEGDAIHDTDTLQVTAAARRVAFFAHMHGGENLNEVGQALFANAVAWAVGDEASLTDIAADPYRVLVILNAAENDEQTRENGSLRDEDFDYLGIIEDDLGYEAVVVDQLSVSPADTADVDMVFISETVGSGDVAGNFIAPMEGNAEHGNVAKPMVVAEVFVLDDLQWIKHQPQPPYGVDFAWGFATSEMIDIQETDHPIAGGLSAGEVDVYDEPEAGEDANQVGYAVPAGASAEIVGAVASDATFNDDPLPDFDETRATLFTYEMGDTLASSDTLNINAAARRATFFAHTRGGDNMNIAGRKLFTNTILWASGRDSEVLTIDPTDIATEPGEELPNSFAIESVYPNPFNPAATVAMSVRDAGSYEVNVYDVLGRLVQKHLFSVTTPGQQHVSLEMSNQASGIYMIQLTQMQTGESAVTHAVLMK